MATIIANGCFDIFHEGHFRFLTAAKFFGGNSRPGYYESGHNTNTLIVALNSDNYARELKRPRWGDRYPIDDLVARTKKVSYIADQIVSFDTEEELHGIIEFMAPCIIVKGPDYAGKRVTGDDLAPIIILDTPEPESVKALKIAAYGQPPSESCKTGTPSD